MLHFASGDGWGGAERALALFVAGAIASREIDVEVLLSNEGQLADTLRSLGAPVTVIPETSVSLPAYARRVREWFRSRRFDALHVHRYREIALGALLPARSRGRLVVTVHGMEPSRLASSGNALRIWTPLLLARLRGARFAAVSEELRARLARVLGTAHVVRIPNPMPPVSPLRVPDLRQAFSWRAERPTVVFAGRLEEVKGPDLFVDVAATAGVDTGFAMIGSGSMEAALRHRVATAGLSDRVGFLGAVPDAMAYLPQADVLALTSRHEGMPMILLEAAACEVPVVAFDVGGVSEVLDGSSAARLIPPGDVAGFRQAIDHIVGNRREIAGELRRWAESTRRRFGLAANSAAYARLYRGEAS